MTWQRRWWTRWGPVGLMLLALMLMAQVTSYIPTSRMLGWVDVRELGARGDNATNDSAAFTAAATRAAAYAVGGGSIYVPQGYYVLGTNVTIPDGVRLIMAAGARLCPAGGVTLTILGSVDIPVREAFCQTGTVTFVGNTHVTTLYPQWWGAVADDGGDDTVAIRAAINSASGQMVMFPYGTYSVTSTIFIDAPHTVHLTAKGYLGATIQRADAMSGDVFVVRVGRCTIEHLYFYDGGTSITKSGGAIYLTGTNLTDRAGFMTINDITVSSAAAGGAWEYGLFINGSSLRTAGTAGIRDLLVKDSFFFGVRTPGRTIYANTCVNCFFSNIGIFPAPTAIMGGIEVRGWDGVDNWSSDVHFQNVHLIGDVVFEAQYVTYTGGSIVSSSATAVTIPSTSQYVQVQTATSVDSVSIDNEGANSYVMGHETPGGTATQQATFPTGTVRTPGFVITGAGGANDYKGMTRVVGALGSNPVARLMAGVLGGGSDWEFGVSDTFASGVNKVPLVVDWLGANVKGNASLRFDGATLAQLPALIGNAAGGFASAGITWCTDCAQGTNPCSAGGGSYAVYAGAWVCPSWP